jgi:hypothetical protein
MVNVVAPQAVPVPSGMQRWPDRASSHLTASRSGFHQGRKLGVKGWWRSRERTLAQSSVLSPDAVADRCVMPYKAVR